MLLQHSYAQEKLFFNYNVNNGLPSNHVYQVVIDTFGYAWIATTKGVLKYNGYKFRKFDEKDGLPKDDVWMLVEDEYNRIWLNSKTYEVGYIKNEKYKGVIRSKGGTGLYPKYMLRIKGGIGFANQKYGSGHMYDTLDVYKVRGDKVFRDVVLTGGSTIPRGRGLTEDGQLFSVISQGIYKLTKDAAGRNKFNEQCSSGIDYLVTHPVLFGLSERYFIIYGIKPDELIAYSLKDCRSFRYTLNAMPGENILGTHQVGDYQHLSTNKRRVVLDSLFRVVHTYWMKDLMPESDTSVNSLVWYVNHDLWKGLSTTSNIGIYHALGNKPFKISDANYFKEANFIGATASGNLYWWKVPTHEMIIQKPNGVVDVRIFKELFSVASVTDYKNGQVFLGNNNGYYLLDESTMKLTYYLKNIKAWYSYGKDTSKMNIPSAGTEGTIFDHTIFIGHEEMYGILHDTIYARVGFNFVWRLAGADGAHEKEICHASQVTDVALKDEFVLSYYEGKLEAHDMRTEKGAALDSTALHALGIDKVKGIVIDESHRNVYLLSNNGVHVYNWGSRQYRKLPLSINPLGCKMKVYKGTLVLLSEYGVVFYRIDLSGNISKPVYVPNYKYSSYRYPVGTKFHMNDSVIVFNTDKGICSLRIPDDSVFIKQSSFTDYRVLVDNNDKVSRLHTGDTIKVATEQSSLLFDVINPVGMGSISYKYSMDGENWITLNANEWYPNSLLPGTYHKMYLQAYDDAWLSDVLTLYVYVQPRWWQTLQGKVVIASVILLGLVVVAFVAALFSRRITIRANTRKNMEAELKSLRTAMELKSIHAQINPHFIFNTLSTGLYFIKKKRFEDAYDHIASFSELLRNYIKSSRDKYISLNEEVENLKKYVLLQQARFENLFDFVVKVEDGINIYTERIPALLLQPLVENAINHGLFHSSSTDGYLKLHFSKPSPEILVCIIDDNGVGREKSKLINADTKHKTQSYGTDLIKELIETFNKYEPVAITIEYIDKQLPETGTTVILTIKSLNADSDND